MRGFITTRDVLSRPILIVGAFGLRVYARCLVRVVACHGRATFLECIWCSARPGYSGPSGVASSTCTTWTRAFSLAPFGPPKR